MINNPECTVHIIDRGYVLDNKVDLRDREDGCLFRKDDKILILNGFGSVEIKRKKRVELENKSKTIVYDSLFKGTVVNKTELKTILRIMDR